MLYAECVFLLVGVRLGNGWGLWWSYRIALFLRSEYIGTKLNMPLLKNRIAGYVGVVATLLP